MIFKRDDQAYKYEVAREAGENVLYVNYNGSKDIPSLIDSPSCMERTINMLLEISNVSKIVLVQSKSYSYDMNHVSMLYEIANIYNYLTKQEKLLEHEAEDVRINKMISIILGLLKKDPIGSYVES